MRVRNKSALLVVAAPLSASLALLSAREFQLPDFATGAIVGVGIGLSLLALRSRRACG